MQGAATDGVTRLLQRWSEGERDALDALLPHVYDELHRLACCHLNGERNGHTLQPTALVNEAYLRLMNQRQVRWERRAHFFGAVSRIMRRILVDHARRRRALKRNGSNGRLVFDNGLTLDVPSGVDLIALDAALDELAALDPRQASVVELRFFVGLSEDEAAAALSISRATLKREWSTARAWLYRRLNGGTGRLS